MPNLREITNLLQIILSLGYEEEGKLVDVFLHQQSPSLKRGMITFHSFKIQDFSRPFDIFYEKLKLLLKPVDTRECDFEFIFCPFCKMWNLIIGYKDSKMVKNHFLVRTCSILITNIWT